MIGVLGSTYPRISTQAFAAEFTEHQQEKESAEPVAVGEISLTIPDRTPDITPPQSLDRAKLVEFLCQLRLNDEHGIYSGLHDGAAQTLDLPHNTR